MSQLADEASRTSLSPERLHQLQQGLTELQQLVHAAEAHQLRREGTPPQQQ